MISSSLEETIAFAENFAKELSVKDIVALDGNLGAGKTSFVQGLAKGLGVSTKQYVRSPTFSLLNIYQGDTPLYHFDFYRLTEKAQFADLGFEEYFDGNGICVIEWANLFPEMLPARTKQLHFKLIDESTREIIVR